MLKGADTDELAARGDSSASGHQTLLISYHGKTFCYRASDCIDGKPEEENSPNGSYRYTHKKYVCELFLITHIHIIRGESCWKKKAVNCIRIIAACFPQEKQT